MPKLTREQIMALEGRELDAAVEAAVGRYEDPLGRDFDGNPFPHETPSFSTDLNAVRQAENEMASRKLWAVYVGELTELVEPKGKPGLPSWTWDMLRAAPATRARAILLTLAEGE